MDIVERLRRWTFPHSDLGDDLKEGADTIERLRAEFVESCNGQHEVEILLQGRIKRLRAALERIERRGLEIISEHVDGSDASYVAQELTALAREALQEGRDGYY